MGIYIKGMEIPRGCAFCKIARRNGKKMVCPFSGEEWDIHDPMSADHRLDNCPLVPVPPHGDLIDAAEEMRLMQSCEYDTYDDYNRAFDMLDNAPTVIPAEE